jgi:hypothetical protein
MNQFFTTKVLHRTLRLVCLAGATAAPVLAAFTCRFNSRFAVKQIFPHSGSEHLPAFTQTWALGVADGSFPLILIALILSAVVAASGIYAQFSKRLSPDAAATTLVVVCCVGYAAGLVMLGSTMMALVLPFVEIGTK